MKLKGFVIPLFLWLCIVLSACSGPEIGTPPPVPTLTFPSRSPSPVSTSSPIPTAWMPPTTPSISVNSGPIVEQARWGKGAIVTSEFSPDGKRLGVITSLGIYTYDAETLNQLDFIPGVPPAAFSPDWSLVALGSGSKVTLLRLADKTEIAQFETDQGGVARLLFSPDGRYLMAWFSRLSRRSIPRSSIYGMCQMANY
jgi:hypothetical protein